MPRIRCHYIDCVFLDDGYCGAVTVEFDPDTGCATYSRTTDIDAEEWETEEEELEDWDSMEMDDDEDLWLDEDEF